VGRGCSPTVRRDCFPALEPPWGKPAVRTEAGARGAAIHDREPGGAQRGATMPGRESGGIPIPPNSLPAILDVENPSRISPCRPAGPTGRQPRPQASLFYTSI